jgi:nitrogen fixation protein FixH
MKVNWGKGIFFAYTLFITASLLSVILFMNQDVELVSMNYYEKEIKYQNRINAIKHTKDLNADVRIESFNNTISLKFPDSCLNEKISGEIVFYRPSDEKKDFRLSVNLNPNGYQTLKSDMLTRGLWKVKIAWKSGINEFYSEKPVMIN